MGILERAALKFVAYLPTIITVVGVLGLAAIPIIWENQNRDWDAFAWLLLALAAMCSVIATVIQSRRYAKLAQNTKADEIRLFDNTLLSSIEKLNQLALIRREDYSTEDEYLIAKHAEFRVLVATVLGRAQIYLTPERGAKDSVRVNYYRLKKDSCDAYYLQVIDRTSQASRQKIAGPRGENREIVERILAGEDVHEPSINDGNPWWANIFSKPLPDERKYKSYTSVATKSLGNIYGMVSANADKRRQLDSSSENFLHVVGGILAMGESMLEESDATPVHIPDGN